MKIPFWNCPKWVKPFETDLCQNSLSSANCEFEQMEIAIFYFQPGTQQEWYDENGKNPYEMAFVIRNGPQKTIVFHDHLKKFRTLCRCCSDIAQFKFPFGFKELEALHSRTDFDLSQA